MKLKLQESIGYLYFIQKDHPLVVGNSGKVYYHRHVASMKIGRWLTSNEHVHHIDGDKLNNEPENLTITTNSEHNHLHKGHREKKACLICGKEFTVFKPSHRFCSFNCSHLGTRKVVRPDINEIIKSVTEIGYSATGRKYGVTDNAIRKWLKRSSNSVD